MIDETRRVLLQMTLNVAVPMWVNRLKGESLESLVRRAPELAQIIGEKGDVIQFRGKKKGETANAFNKLAEAIAILSFMPGGVKFLGDHYQSTHPDNSAIGVCVTCEAYGLIDRPCDICGSDVRECEQ